MILFLVIPTIKQGGAERVMSELANEFASSNQIKVHLVLLAKSDDFYNVNDKVILHRLGFENRGKFQKVIAEIQAFFALRKLLKMHKPDAVLSFMEKYNSFTILASSFLGLKVFVSDRSNPLKKVPLSTELLRKLTYKHATGIVAQTQFAKDILSEKTKNTNIKVIPNPIKDIQINPKVNKERIIINVGRLVVEKGQTFLVEAFSKLEVFPEWQLVILGEGPLRVVLEQQVRDLDLVDRVHFLGAVTNVDEWLARASIFVFPSISEGFPNALVEAMGAGLPCISFDCDTGPRYIIKDNQNGFLVQNRDITSLTNKLNKLCKSDELRQKIGREAEKIKEELNAVKITKEYLEFLTTKSNETRN